MKLIYFFLLGITLTSFSFAQKKENVSSKIDKATKKKGVKFIKAKVVVYQGETLGDILRRFVRDDSVIFREEKMVDMTLKNNPQVKDWRNLKAGESIYVYLDPKFIDDKKLNDFRKTIKKVTKKIEKKVKKQVKKNKVKKFSTFYMASIGQFNQEKSGLAEVDFKQNSPLTLGVMYTHIPKKGNYTISSSAYFSYLLTATSNTESDNVELPLEVGLNSYYQRPAFNGQVYLYGGVDYEKFNTFNLVGTDAENDVFIDENRMLFLTGGVSRTLNMFNRKFLFKGSLSYSVFSNRSVGYSGDDTSDGYSGYKLMGFFLSKVHKDFFISNLWKFHSLSGPSNVTALRVGLGCGYLF